MRVFGLVKSWRPEAIKEAALKKSEGRMRLAVIFLEGQIKRAINRGNPGGRNPSRPGEPPKKVSGRLFLSIFSSVKRTGNQVFGFVGSSAKHARHLELGTSQMEPRPFFRPTLQKNRDRIARMLGAK